MPHHSFPTALGLCGIYWNDRGLTGFRLPAEGDYPASRQLANRGENQPAPPAVSPSNPPAMPTPPWVAEVVARVQRHLSDDLQDFADVRFDFSSVSPFQKAVYTAALTVKPGSTRTYGWLAEAIGETPAVSRAVGTALGQNPWPLLVPCHRFVGAGGKMTGFSAPGGIKTKLRLLAIEGAELFAE